MQKTWNTRGTVCGREACTVYPFVPLLFEPCECITYWRKQNIKRAFVAMEYCSFPNTKHRVWHLTDNSDSLENRAWRRSLHTHHFRNQCSPREVGEKRKREWVREPGEQIQRSVLLSQPWLHSKNQLMLWCPERTWESRTVHGWDEGHFICWVLPVCSLSVVKSTPWGIDAFYPSMISR